MWFRASHMPIHWHQLSTFYYLKNQQIACYTWIFHRHLDIASFPLSALVTHHFLLISLIYNISHHSTLAAYLTVVATDVGSTSTAATIPCPDSPVLFFLPSFH